MIEIELKFNLSKKEEALLLQNATFIEQQEFTDVYYDTKSFELTTNDIWLRSRNDVFILKLPIPTDNPLLLKQSNTFKKEIDNELEIRKALHVPLSKSLPEDLLAVGILPLYRFFNVRRKFVKEGFIIDIDVAHFDDFSYEACEIELVVDSPEKANCAMNRIEEFAKRHGLEVRSVRGRLIEYLYRKHPEHYAKLKK